MKRLMCTCGMLAACLVAVKPSFAVVPTVLGEHASLLFGAVEAEEMPALALPPSSRVLPSWRDPLDRYLNLGLPAGAGQQAFQSATYIAAGIDLFTTPGGTTTYHNFGLSPIPPDFFDPGSDPFMDGIYFQGVPLVLLR